GGGFWGAAEALGIGIGEFVEFLDVEDPAGHEVDDDHDDADDRACEDAVDARGHRPAARVAARRIQQGDPEDAGDDPGPAGADVGRDHGVDAVVAKVSFGQDVGGDQLDDVDGGDDQGDQVRDGFDGHQWGQRIGQTQRRECGGDLDDHRDGCVFGCIEHAQQVEVRRPKRHPEGEEQEYLGDRVG